MDFFAHIAWAYVIFRKLREKGQLFYALLFAALPDMMGWGAFTIYAFTNGMMRTHDFSKIPDWTWTLYGISHSLIVYGIILLIVWLVLRRIPLFMLAYPIHILIDIPTHSRQFLPTPFLWPVSGWHFPGFSWGQAWFMLLNWGAILILIIYINRKNIKKIFKRTT